MRVLWFLAAALILSPVSFTPPSSAYQKATVYVCPMHPEVQSSKAGTCPKCKMALVVRKPKAATATPVSKPALTQSASREIVPQADSYMCPMHPDVRSSKPGECPKCKMTLVAVNPEMPDEFDLRLDAAPRMPKASEPVKLHFRVFNPRTG